MDDLTPLPPRIAVLVAALLAAATLGIAAWGLLGGPLAEEVAYDILVFVALVLGYNIFSGSTGYLSFGHGLFYALGGYIAVLLAGVLGSVGAVLAAGLFNAVLAAAALGPLLRTRGPYFAVASLALFLAVGSVVSMIPELGGSEGLVAPPGAGLDTARALAAVEALVVLGIAVSLFLGVTALGKRVIAVRDNEEAARSLGLSPLPYRLAMLSLSGFIVGAVGGVYFLSYGGHGYVDPELAFDPRTNILVVLAAIAGGLGSLTGVFMGAILVKALDNLLAMYSPLIASLLGYKPSEATMIVTTVPYVVLGALVAAIALAAPRGIHGFLESRLYNRFVRLARVPGLEARGESREGR